MANYQFSLTQVMQATNAILKKLTSASVFGGVTTLEKLKKECYLLP